jgi:periplasmic divalent cation tolerance protein
MAKVLQVHVTVPDRERAESIARALVGERLAACVNILPGIRSIYRWQGEVHADDEVLCLIKTEAERFAALAERVKALHPYDVPEIIAVEIAAGSAEYLAWVSAETAAASPGTAGA